MPSQPGILPVKMPGQHGAESAWQLPVPKSCQFLVSRILSLLLSRKAASQHFCYFKMYLKIASLSIPIVSLGKESLKKDTLISLFFQKVSLFLSF